MVLALGSFSRAYVDRTRFFALSIVIGSLATFASADLEVFDNDEAGFNTKVSNTNTVLTTDSFEDLVSSSIGSPLVRTDYSVTGENISEFRKTAPALRIDGNVSFSVDDNEDALLFAFDTPINVFSLQLGAVDLITDGANLIDSSLSFSVDGGAEQFLDIGTTPGSFDIFLGLFDDTNAFSTIRIDREVDNTPIVDVFGQIIPFDAYDFDVVQYGTVLAAVPEPSTVGLILGGVSFLLYTSIRRRKSKRTDC
ncbi:PEP-CTERM sorting domain-containing protein [Puniceicoccaceae bacterium K14]|nr:PEP-CTERM sorting domain-containing protein [Puniceicoccaceae bacterium K14]